MHDNTWFTTTADQHEAALDKWEKGLIADARNQDVTWARIASRICSLLSDRLVQIVVKVGVPEGEFLAMLSRQYREYKQHVETCDCDVCTQWRKTHAVGDADEKSAEQTLN